MKTRIAVLGSLLLLGASAVYAADNESRTYSNPACTDRNAKPGDCVIQDGPPRRRGQPEAPPTPPDKRDGKSDKSSQTGRK
jgi:hypothetical protein